MDQEDSLVRLDLLDNQANPVLLDLQVRLDLLDLVENVVKLDLKDHKDLRVLLDRGEKMDKGNVINYHGAAKFYTPNFKNAT